MWTNSAFFYPSPTPLLQQVGILFLLLSSCRLSPFFFIYSLPAEILVFRVEKTLLLNSLMFYTVPTSPHAQPRSHPGLVFLTGPTIHHVFRLQTEHLQPLCCKRGHRPLSFKSSAFYPPRPRRDPFIRQFFIHVVYWLFFPPLLS